MEIARPNGSVSFTKNFHHLLIVHGNTTMIIAAVSMVPQLRDCGIGPVCHLRLKCCEPNLPVCGSKHWVFLCDMANPNMGHQKREENIVLHITRHIIKAMGIAILRSVKLFS